jgi:hypothetical protein
MCPERCSHDFTGRAMWCAVLIKAPWEKPAENSRAASGGGLYSSYNVVVQRKVSIPRQSRGL